MRLLVALWRLLRAAGSGAVWWCRRRLRRSRRLDGRHREASRMVVELEVHGLEAAAATARRLADELEDAAAAADRLPAGLRRQLELGPHVALTLPAPEGDDDWELAEVWECLGETPTSTRKVGP